MKIPFWVRVIVQLVCPLPFMWPTQSTCFMFPEHHQEWSLRVELEVSPEHCWVWPATKGKRSLSQLYSSEHGWVWCVQQDIVGRAERERSWFPDNVWSYKLCPSYKQRCLCSWFYKIQFKKLSVVACRRFLLSHRELVYRLSMIDFLSHSAATPFH